MSINWHLRLNGLLRLEYIPSKYTYQKANWQGNSLRKIRHSQSSCGSTFCLQPSQLGHSLYSLALLISSKWEHSRKVLIRTLWSSVCSLDLPVYSWKTKSLFFIIAPVWGICPSSTKRVKRLTIYVLTMEAQIEIDNLNSFYLSKESTFLLKTSWPKTTASKNVPGHICSLWILSNI